MPRKKKDLTELLMELKKTRQKEDNQHMTQTTDNRGITIKEIKIIVEIPQLEDLTKEVRQLREAITDFVRIIKTRLEETEEEEQEDKIEQQPPIQIEERNEH